jgi:hypothetical protein
MNCKEKKARLLPGPEVRARRDVRDGEVPRVLQRESAAQAAAPQVNAERPGRRRELRQRLHARQKCDCKVRCALRWA